MKRKKKIKMKKNSYILVILIALVLLLICIPKKAPQKEPKKELTEEEMKYEKLNHIDQKIDYFKKDYLDRYLAYQEKNPNIDTIQIIKNVNMQLDQNWYENPMEAIHQNTPLVLVNKHYYLNENYIPEHLEEVSSSYALNGMQLVDVARQAFESLSKDAKNEGLSIVALSSYRSYEYQVTLYNRYVKEDGQEAADTYSGRPGYSEHQTGLAVDVYNMKESYTNFENTEEYQWMMKHAHEYGFILRFPKEKEQETGYQFESWHYRYVGKEAATYIKEHNISLEEYIATKKDW